MAIDTVRDVLSAVPGATPTSTYRTPERNRRVGGTPGSHHTRGTPDNPRAVDLVPAPGESMAQLEARLRSSGVNTVELINEGDHVHVAVDGQAREAGGDDMRTGPDGRQYRVTASEDITAAEAERLVASGEYQRDPVTNAIFRVVGREDAPVIPAPLDNAYAERQAARESLALDQEEADIMMSVQFQTPGDVVADAGARMMGAGPRNSVGLEAVAATAGLDRSMGERFWDNVDQAFNLSAAGYLDRMIDPQNDGVDPVADFFLHPEILEGKPLDWVLDQLLGENRSYFRSVTEETRRSAPAIRAERERRERYQARAEADPVANVGDGLASLLGMLGGSAVSPESWVAPGKTVLGRVAAGGAVGGATDAMLQGADVASGVQDEFNTMQTVGATVASGALVGVGELVGGMVRARRSAAQQRGLQVDPIMDAAEAAAEGQAVQAAVREALGNPEGPRFRVARDPEVIVPFQTKIDAADAPITPRDVTASADNVFDINLARINTPEDVQAVIVGMADRMAKDVDLARRGRISQEATREAADGVDWVTSMGARRTGQAMNAEEITAYRLALNSSATKLDELAAAVEANPSVANQFALRRAASVHSAIQNEFFGARAEAGRALNAFKIPADAPATYLRQVDQLIADTGGANTALDLARAIRAAKRNGDIELNEMLRGGGAMAKSREILKLVWTNGKLSALGTPIWNVLGNASLLGLNVATRVVAPRFARVFGGQGVTQVGEAARLVHGYQSAIRDMFRLNPFEAAERIGANAGEAMRREGVWRGMAPGIDDAAPDNITLRAEREDAGSTVGRPLAAAAWRVSEDSTLGRILDIFQMIVESPSNVNALSDDFFKVVAARGELHAQAFRRVAQQGLEGEAARKLYDDLMLNPTDDMLKAAEREMHDLTLTRDVGPRDHSGERETASRTTAQSLLDLRSSWDSAGPIPFGSLLFPFVKTPANLISKGMQFSPLAPFSRRFRNDIAAGGARAETAKAQVAVGTALWSVWMGMAMDGDLTGGGPGNRGQREAMQRVDEYGGTVFQPYSVRVGNRWIAYERGDPIAQGMSLVADMADLIKNGDWDNEQNGELDEIASHVVMSLGQAFFNKTMLKGASEVSAALLDGKVADAERLLISQTAGMVPFSGMSRTIRRGTDPYMRETADVIAGLANITPGLSDNLPVQRDLWGRERRYYSEAPTEAVMNVIGFQTREVGGSAIDLEILNNGVSVAMPSRSISYMGETVSLKNRPDIYSEFMRLAGEPAFEHLNAVAEGRHEDSAFYFGLSDGPSGERADYIKGIIGTYRDEARAQITEMYANDLERMAADKVRRREEARSVE